MAVHIMTARSALAAAASGVFAVGLTHPLDTWAIHAQTGRPPPGFNRRALYRGLAPALLQASLIYGAMLGTYEVLRLDCGCSVVAAAALSAVPESAVKGPFEAAKNLRQTGVPFPRAPRAAARLLGVSFVTMLSREVPGNCAYFSAYEELRRTGANPALSGCGAAAAFTACSYPLDALRAQIITGTKLEFTLRGIVPYLTRGMAVTAILMTSYEWVSDRAGVKRSLGKSCSRSTGNTV